MSQSIAEAITTSSARLVGIVASLTDSDLRPPSRLPDWSVGHTLAHIALNAEAFVRVAADRRKGALGVMYPHGVAGRGADIELLAGATADELSARLAQAVHAYDAAWSSPVPEGPVCSAIGLPEFSSVEIASRRLREVEVHSFDTGLPQFGYAHWSNCFVDGDLPVQWANATRRTDQPMFFVDEDGTEWRAGSSIESPLTVTKHALLAWLLDRETLEGSPTLVGWGDQSRWSK